MCLALDYMYMVGTVDGGKENKPTFQAFMENQYMYDVFRSFATFI